jgi:alpha-tubulin suppressor-like RCC1 family protein
MQSQQRIRVSRRAFEPQLRRLPQFRPRADRCSRLIGVVAIGMGIFGCREGATSPERHATSLAFKVQPSGAEGSIAISPPPQVAILDQFQNTDTTAALAVTVALGANPGGATLVGTTTVTAVAGVATFTDVRIDRPAAGYTLTASASNLAIAASASFDVHLTFTRVSTGRSHSCGLTSAGFAYCWGANDYGQLGDGSRAPHSTPAPVTGGMTFAEVSTGGYFTCAVTGAGAAYCWGSNYTGQLGDGTTDDRPTPTAVAGGLSVSQLSAGFLHTCMVTVPGVAYCWGSNLFGELGDGTSDLRLVPTPVTAAPQFAHVTAGGFVTCGVAASGAAYCWGYAGGGQPADSTNPNSSVPRLLYGGLSFAELSANPGSDQEWHVCAVTIAGDPYCWGSNFYGQLGDSTVDGHMTPTEVFGGLKMTHITTGRSFSCALGVGGRGYCWGMNSNGQLGDGSLGYQLSPTAVAGSNTFSQISARFMHACGVTVEHAAYCWGANESGQLGDGTATERRVPTRVVQ